MAHVISPAARFTPSWNPHPKLVLRHSDRRRLQLAEEAELDRVYRQVNVRDDNKCRCCGRLTSIKPGMVTARHHNHLQKRSTVPKAVKHTTRNIHLACGWCDALITAGKIRIVGRNCDRALAFLWTPLSTAREREGLRLRDERTAA